MKNKMLFLMAVSMLGSAQANAAIMACKPGPNCDKLRQVVTEVKATKGKRHKDVQEFGRLSAQKANVSSHFRSQAKANAKLALSAEKKDVRTIRSAQKPCNRN
jgi:cell division protein FtsL